MAGPARVLQGAHEQVLQEVPVGEVGLDDARAAPPAADEVEQSVDAAVLLGDGGERVLRRALVEEVDDDTVCAPLPRGVVRGGDDGVGVERRAPDDGHNVGDSAGGQLVGEAVDGGAVAVDRRHRALGRRRGRR